MYFSFVILKVPLRYHRTLLVAFAAPISMFLNLWWFSLPVCHSLVLLFLHQQLLDSWCFPFDGLDLFLIETFVLQLFSWTSIWDHPSTFEKHSLGLYWLLYGTPHMCALWLWLNENQNLCRLNSFYPGCLSWGSLLIVNYLIGVL